MKPSRALIWRYMQMVLEDHRDPHTGEINATTLAEDAADKFKYYDPERPGMYSPHERLFEMAFEFAEREERRRRSTLGSAAAGLINSNDDCLRG